MPKKEQCYVDIWFVSRPKETHYDILINGSASQLNDDEWPHYHRMSMLVCFCLGLLKFDTGSRFALEGLRRHLQAKINDRDIVC